MSRPTWRAPALVAVLVIVAAVALVGFAPGQSTANAVYNVQLNNNPFGNLDQDDVASCKDQTGASFSCGAVAAVNSFAYLQRRYPQIYDEKLIPDSNNNDLIDYAELKATAEIVAWHQECDPQAGGTAISNFISGKKSYIESQIPNVTVYKDQNFWGNPSVTPTFAFLFQELQHGEDVELLLGFYGTQVQGRLGGHYVTLTGLAWMDADMDGVIDQAEGATMTFIDPATGASDTRGVETLSGFLRTAYGVGGGTLNTFVEAGVSESPVPEPGALALLGPGLALAAGVAWRRRR